MLSPKASDYCILPPAEKPRLVLVVDTEEEFDWSSEFSRHSTSVRSVRSIHSFQKILDEYGICPVYVIDYPVATQRDGFQPLVEIHSERRCLIGSHLHPWVNPPFLEAICCRNSFAGNLPSDLEAAKLRTLSECIAERFGVRPTIYKAGRYGVGSNTAEILDKEGYEVDISVCPHMDYSAEDGPDFTGSSAWPYWFGRRRLLELPLTIGFAGLLRRWGNRLHGITTRWPMDTLHAAGMLARVGLVNRIWLSPEGYRVDELKKLVRGLCGDGLRVFSFTFHSPSLECGNTPYVRSKRDLEDFLTSCRRFFDFFMGDIGGIPVTPLQLKAQLAHTKQPGLE